MNKKKEFIGAKWCITMCGICISGILMGVGAVNGNMGLAGIGLIGYIGGVILNYNLMDQGGFKK